MKSSQLQKESSLDVQKLAAGRFPEDREADVGCSMYPKDTWNRVKWLLIAILLLAFGLRVWGITYGLPYELTYDESKEILRALKLGAGEYYWGFGKGGLYYILFVEYAFLFGYWWITGQVANGAEFAIEFIRDPSIFFLLGRFTVVIMGTITCLLVYYIGRRLYDWRVGLGAALIGATAYAHAAHSHIVNVDVGMTLAMWGSLLAYIKYEENSRRRWLPTAGMLAGLAIAFKLPGAVVLLALFLAIGSRSDNWFKPGLMLKEAGIIVLAAIATLTIVAPEWIYGIGSSLQPYYWFIHGKTAATEVFEGDRHEAFRLVTTRSGQPWSGYLQLLVSHRNVLLTVAALAGAIVGLIRRERWTIIWSALVVLFVGAMSVSSRGQPEHYLLPILPSLWLLSSYAIMTIAAQKKSLMAVGFAGVVVMPSVELVRQNREWSQPDTRVVAKEWIEANVPPRAKILADSFQHRFTPSPPLTPDESAVLRQVEGVLSEPNRFRGVSPRTLKLYAEAMHSMTGPRYELHPTVWGLAVEDPSYYAEHCFNYIITSSMISKRYAAGKNRERFPKSARFYEQLDSDPRLQRIYSVEPIAWRRTGPTITVYKLLSSCTTSVRGKDERLDNQLFLATGERSSGK